MLKVKGVGHGCLVTVWLVRRSKMGNQVGLVHLMHWVKGGHSGLGFGVNNDGYGFGILV